MGVVDAAARAETDALLVKAQAAVRAGNWAAAKSGFEAALAHRETGEALFGLGIAHQWLGEPHAALRHWERACTDFRRRDDAVHAVMAAFYLCLGYRMNFGNDAASRGWCERAASLVEDLGDSQLNGWVELARAYVANESGHPREAEVHARTATAIAYQSADRDLELCAKGELGAVLIAIGRVDDGTALLARSDGRGAGRGGRRSRHRRAHQLPYGGLLRSRRRRSQGGPVGSRGGRVQPPLRLAAPLHHQPHALRGHPVRDRQVGGRGA
jgi:tetratricopeptide (TPR) repeat protein